MKFKIEGKEKTMTQRTGEKDSSVLPVLTLSISGRRAVEVSSHAGGIIEVRTNFEDGIDAISAGIDVLAFEDVKILASRIRGSKLYRAILALEE